MAITAGIDVGVASTRGAALEDGKLILSVSSVKTGTDLQGAAAKALQAVLDDAHLKRGEIGYLATTGFGRYIFPDRDIQITEVTCHARGAHFLFPETRTVLDIGAQGFRGIKIDDRGKVKAFRLNEKCAGGSGRFLERVGRYLGVPLTELGDVAMRSRSHESISTVCAVLAETEIINLVTSGKELENIVMGAHAAVASRAVSILKQVGIQPEITLTGALSLNKGMVKALQEKTGLQLKVSQLSPYAGAIGAALLGYRRLEKLSDQQRTLEILSRERAP